MAWIAGFALSGSRASGPGDGIERGLRPPIFSNSSRGQMIDETGVRELSMAQHMATRLEEFFEERTEGHLRSIINYEEREYEIVYLRADVAEEYTEEELQKAVDESIMDSLAAPVYGNVFSEDHGELTCLVQCFKNVIEMNFVLADGVGTAVALDVEAMGGATGIVAEARRIVLEERE